MRRPVPDKLPLYYASATFAKTWIPFPAIYFAKAFKLSLSSLGIPEITHRSSPKFDRLRKDGAGVPPQFRHLLFGNISGRRPGMNTACMENLVGVNIADSRNFLLLQKKIFYPSLLLSK